MGKKKVKSNCEEEAIIKKVKLNNHNEYECEPCQRVIHGGSSSISEHLQGSKHKWLMHVYYLSNFFK